MYLSVKSYNPSESVIQTYKARTMNGMFEPAAVYDDIKLCNSVGVYKNGGDNNEGLFTGESNYLQNMQPQLKSENEILEGEFIYYPNPTECELIVKYSLLKDEKATIKVYDVLGREMISQAAKQNSKQQKINVSMLSIGIYTIQFQPATKAKQSGKFLKQ
jgi:hypothetical protein